ncbi:LysR family transcriptional regulator [Iodobacter ciconiae]|uniref:LysR family transcriptional regulator n=2 Tax=Iodobacter ciconiae TaxID=2496266 RepID=A0A3S8ZXL2_9NEIS|nr:LysR family transcriptional regulator [Iodobacter ciconiae]
MKIEANDLLLFARVIECGSFSRAAERIGLPKSTVSRRIANMETALGERLLIRSTRKLLLTEFGKHVLDHASQIASEVDAAVALVEHRQAEPSGLLRISLPGDMTGWEMDQFLSHFSLRYPLIRLEIDITPRRVDILAENFDLAIRIGELPSDAHLSARRLALFSVGLYASPFYIAQRGLPEHPDQLAAHDALAVLSRQGGAMPWVLQRGKVSQHFQPVAKFSINSPQLLVRLACQGMGVLAVTESFAKSYLQQGLLVRILPEWCMPAVPAWAVFPERRLMPAKTRVFLDQLEQVLRSD